MTPDQNPMKGFKTLELAFSQGFKMARVPFMPGVFFTKDKALGYDRYTYAVLNSNKVRQTVVLNGNEPLKGLPCFCLFYVTHEELRGTGVTVPFIEAILKRFPRDLPRRYQEYYIETIVDTDNEASLSVAAKIFGEADYDGVDQLTGIGTHIWQKIYTRQ